MSFDPNAPVFVPPNVNEDPPVHPTGTHGADGSSEIVTCAMMWFHDKKRHDWDAQPADDAVPFLYLGVRTNDPNLGPVMVFSNPFGDYNTSARPNSGKTNRLKEFQANLGLAGLPPAEYKNLIGRKVTVEVKGETYKGKPQARLVNIWLNP